MGVENPKFTITFEPMDPRLRMGARLLEDFSITSHLHIPAGYEWDGATIPRVFWSLVGGPFDLQIVAASLVHDWLYFTRLWDRKKADRALRDLMVAAGAPQKRARVIYRAVRVFGALFYRRTKADREYACLLAAELRAQGRDPVAYQLPQAFEL